MTSNWILQLFSHETRHFTSFNKLLLRNSTCISHVKSFAKSRNTFGKRGRGGWNMTSLHGTLGHLFHCQLLKSPYITSIAPQHWNSNIISISLVFYLAPCMLSEQTSPHSGQLKIPSTIVCMASHESARFWFPFYAWKLNEGPVKIGIRLSGGCSIQCKMRSVLNLQMDPAWIRR